MRVDLCRMLQYSFSQCTSSFIGNPKVFKIGTSLLAKINYSAMMTNSRVMMELVSKWIKDVIGNLNVVTRVMKMIA